MESDKFREALIEHFSDFQKAIASDDGDWTVKGFIDIYKNIYTISVDTKVVSKIMELMLFPLIMQFAAKHNYRVVLSEHQNHYPDITFVAEDETKIALDVKSTYRTDSDKVSGFTLGAFTGYFRDRTSTKNCTYPYGAYAAHFVLGVIYSRSKEVTDERKVYTLDDLSNIVSVVSNFTFLLQEKWRIASALPGSGNTKNIGSIHDINDLIEGKGPFVSLGEKVFDHYWMNYLTDEMARRIDSVIPYHNLDTYQKWLKMDLTPASPVLKQDEGVQGALDLDA